MFILGAEEVGLIGQYQYVKCMSCCPFVHINLARLSHLRNKTYVRKDECLTVFLTALEMEPYWRFNFIGGIFCAKIYQKKNCSC